MVEPKRPAFIPGFESGIAMAGASSHSGRGLVLHCVKTPLHLTLVVLASLGAHRFAGGQVPAGAMPGVGASIIKEFGEAQLKNVVLVRAAPNESDPVQWTVYSRDPYRPGEQLRTIATHVNGTWTSAPAGAGKLLPRVPKRTIDFTRLRISAMQARQTLNQAAALAQVAAARVDYRLAANDQTGAPEWALAVLDASGGETGFCIVSGETGALTFQDWTRKPDPAATARPSTPESEGERAARKVKRGMRKAWDWTEDAGRQTGGFFRELFKDGDKD